MADPNSIPNTKKTRAGAPKRAPRAETATAKAENPAIQPQAPAPIQYQAAPQYQPAPQYIAPPEPVAQSYIVRNITPGPHCITDLKITFQPFQALDLTHLDGSKVKTSLDLRNSIRRGILERITEDDYEYILKSEETRRQADIRKAQQRRQTRQATAGDRNFEAEDINLNADGGSANEANISTAGYANDMESYAMAYHQAKTQAAANGRSLDAREFDDMIKSGGIVMFNPGSLGPIGSTSGQVGSGRAVVGMPPTADGVSGAPMRMAMSNHARDGYIAGGQEAGIQQFSHPDSLDLPLAEEIDLALNDDDDDF